ncbi:MAG: iron-containing alcohol dehydrogenase [Eubacteriales bacterium]|nr:iron-containing alcohol dehydrogenase [Eubacteriales bacterium]
MFFLKTVFCRVFQGAFRIALPLLPYREPETVTSCSELQRITEKEKVKSVLIVTDKGIAENGLTEPIEEALKCAKISYTVYDKTCPNPTVHNVEEAYSVYRQNGCDCLLAVGGGSSMDCAKAVGARAVYPKKSVGKMKGILRVLRPLPTLVAVPTTAGTGSETTLAAIITDSEKHHKYALMSFPLIPHYAVLDPTLTYSLPKSLTATTGMDALTHAVEAYIGRSTTKQTRQLSLDAVKLIFDNIETVYRDGNNLQARKNMLEASYMAGVAFSKSYVGYIHAVAHSLGGQYGTPHGLANAVIMPYVLRVYGETVCKKLHRLGIAAGVCTANQTDKDAAESFIKAIEELNLKMGIPRKISVIKADDIPTMAKNAEKEANPLYPVPKLMTVSELESIYYQISDWS